MVTTTTYREDTRGEIEAHLRHGGAGGGGEGDEGGGEEVWDGLREGEGEEGGRRERRVEDTARKRE